MFRFYLFALLIAILLSLLLGPGPSHALAPVFLPVGVAGGVALHAAPDHSLVNVSVAGRTRPSGANQTIPVAATGCCFSNSCLNWSLDPDGHNISGECWNKEDQRHWVKVESSLDLDSCLLNTDGKLIPSYQYVFLACISE